MIRVKLLSNGALDQNTLLRLKESLLEVFPISHVILDDQATYPPSSCLNRSREQYNSTLFLRFLRRSIQKENNEKILVVLSLDLYAGHLNFVFGEADPSTGLAVVSTHRLRAEFYGEAPSPALSLNRLIKESVHELGHTFGLGHCSDSTCVMHFSNSILDTDLKGFNLCPRCRFKLKS